MDEQQDDHCYLNAFGTTYRILGIATPWIYLFRPGTARDGTYPADPRSAHRLAGLPEPPPLAKVNACMADWPTYVDEAVAWLAIHQHDGIFH